MCTYALQGPSEVDRHFQADTGLSDVAIKEITIAWNDTMGALQSAFLEHGGYTWSLINGQVCVCPAFLCARLVCLPG